MTMKRRIITEILAVTAVALGATATLSQSSKAQPAPGQRGFFCDTSTGTPVTVYQNSQGGQEPWIQWESDAFSGAGYDPLTRCGEVSRRLETYRQNKQLRYITTGFMNNQPVICTASQVNGRCDGLIYTLKPNQDPIATLYKLLAWREGQAGTSSLSESGQIPYIDVRGRLENETPAVTSPRSHPQPVRPQQTPNSGLREL